MKNPFSKHPVKTILGIGMIAASIIIGMRFMDTALTVADIDPEYTADWDDLCVGRFKMKVPKDFINDEMNIGFLYDGIHIEQLPGAYDTGSFAQFISAKEVEIKQETAAISGVEAILVNEWNEQSYLVAYRDDEEVHISIQVRAYRLINGRVIELWVDTLDGIDDGPFGMFKDKREQNNAHYKSDLEIVSRIMHQLTPITDVKKVGKGLCLSNEVILEDNPEKFSSYVMKLGGRHAKKGGQYSSIRLDFIVGGMELTSSFRAKAFENIAKNTAFKLTANGIGGVFESRPYKADPYDKYIKWYSLDSKPGDLQRPDMRVELRTFAEEAASIEAFSKDRFDNFFSNLMASLRAHKS